MRTPLPQLNASPQASLFSRVTHSLAHLLKPAAKKSYGSMLAFETLATSAGHPRDYAAFAREGMMQNAILYRSVRMVSEAAASVPLLLYAGDREIDAHPLLDLLARPCPGMTGIDLLESLYGHLLVSGNAYLEAVALDGAIKGLNLLRPDRVRVVASPDGWVEDYDYTVDGRTQRIGGEAVEGVGRVLHQKLFHPLSDHYGLSPIEPAAAAIDIHNTAARWNKALLDNSARPSGALVYTAGGELSVEQFDRLKRELADSFQGARNAGRPLLLEGGLDWKAMSLSPRDLDFIESKNAAAREIALAIGVPPMLLAIPGDNTYSNYQEANRSFWRQTVLPLVARTSRALSRWLAPAWDERLDLRPDLDDVPALTSEREALWARIDKATFLTRREKREAVGYASDDGGGSEPGNDADQEAGADASRPFDRPFDGKFNPYHNDHGRFTFKPDGGDDEVDLVAELQQALDELEAEGANEEDDEARVQQVSLARRLLQALTKKPSPPKPSQQPLADILRPGGKEIGQRSKGAGEDVRTLDRVEFESLKSKLLDGTKEVLPRPEYKGKWHERPDGTRIGIRESDRHGPTIDIIEGGPSGIQNGLRFHIP